MIQLAPFCDIQEHQAFCQFANVPFEDESVGFKIFTEEDALGLCQIKVVQDAAYILNLCSIEERISPETLANVFTEIMVFLDRLQLQSVVFPVQNESDILACDVNGFDAVTDTLYVFDFCAKLKEESTDQ